MARRGGDLACLMVAYFIGEGVLVMLFLASEYSRTRLEGCTVTPYLQLNGLILIAICFFYGLFSALIFDIEKLVEAELSPGAPAHSTIELSLLLGAVTVIFSVIYTFYLRSCTNSLGWKGWILALGFMATNGFFSIISGVMGIWLVIGPPATNWKERQSKTLRFYQALMIATDHEGTSQEKPKYLELMKKPGLPQDFNPVDEYFFRKYLVYSTSRQLLDVIIEQGHSCPVCLTNFELNDLIIHAECKDLFHWECLRTHLILDKICPDKRCNHKTAFLSELRNKVISTTRKDVKVLAEELCTKQYRPPTILDPFKQPRIFGHSGPRNRPDPNFMMNRFELERPIRQEIVEIWAVRAGETLQV